jgi:general secretion pathway protein G
MSRFNTRRARSSKGFTLVEILIVVIILGILAAIVIPQFSNASQDARKSSLTSQLQTLRSQINLYSLQHLDKFPPDLVTGGANAWALMLVKTNADHSTTGTPAFGPYLQTAPVNNLNGFSAVDSTIATDLGSGGIANPGSATSGWLFNASTGKLWATSAKGGYVYNEANPADDNNVSK